MTDRTERTDGKYRNEKTNRTERIERIERIERTNKMDEENLNKQNQDVNEKTTFQYHLLLTAVQGYPFFQHIEPLLK